MSRRLLHIAAFAVLVAGLGMPAQAQNSAPYESASSEAGPLLLPPTSAAPARFASQTAVTPTAMQVDVPNTMAAPQQAGYVRLNAPLYPSPRPNIPIWTGGTMITNQAFAPHEMLYPHTYRAIYPPFYHRVHGKYLWTPFGMRTHEKWQLQGTMVQVKYRSHWPKLGGPHPPVISTMGPPWK